jgi:o-succinylbenzoate synthase
LNIQSIHLRHLRMKLQSHFETSFGRIYHRDAILISLYSDGLVGYGECVADHDPGYAYETTQTAWHILKDFLIPTLLDLNIQQPQEVPAALRFVRGHPMAKAGLEMAVWDLYGKMTRQSLRSLLGGTSRQVPVGVSVGLQDTTAELVRVVSGYLDQGYKRIKIKIKPGRDVSEAQAVRQAFPALQLQVDANSAYNLDQALQALRPLDDLNLLLIEQPLAEDDLWDHHRLQEAFETPICLDESILSARHARQAIEMNACKIINIKAGRVGGLSEAIAIHNLCYQQDVPVWCGGMLETGVGRAANLALASLPGFRLPGDISASDRYYAQDITKERFTLNPDSTINVPEGHGLGVSIDEEALGQATLTHLVLPD